MYNFFNLINTFLKKLTLLSKILLTIVIFSIIFFIIFILLSFRYVGNNEKLFNTNTKNYENVSGLVFKSRFKYKIVDFSTNELNYDLVFQDANLKTYKTVKLEDIMPGWWGTYKQKKK
jgi:hypothetical protein